jgi:hypothetical protein
VHLVPASLNCAGWKEHKQVAVDLKTVYAEPRPMIASRCHHYLYRNLSPDHLWILGRISVGSVTGLRFGGRIVIVIELRKEVGLTIRKTGGC